MSIWELGEKENFVVGRILLFNDWASTHGYIVDLSDSHVWGHCVLRVMVASQAGNFYEHTCTVSSFTGNH